MRERDKEREGEKERAREREREREMGENRERNREIQRQKERKRKSYSPPFPLFLRVMGGRGLIKIIDCHSANWNCAAHCSEGLWDIES